MIGPLSWADLEWLYGETRQEHIPDEVRRVGATYRDYSRWHRVSRFIREATEQHAALCAAGQHVRMFDGGPCWWCDECGPVCEGGNG